MSILPLVLNGIECVQKLPPLERSEEHIQPDQERSISYTINFEQESKHEMRMEKNVLSLLVVSIFVFLDRQTSPAWCLSISIETMATGTAQILP